MRDSGDEAYAQLTSYKVKTTKFKVSCDSALMNYPKYSREAFPESLRIVWTIKQGTRITLTSLQPSDCQRGN